MDALEAIFTRRSIRAYTGQPIGEADLAEILSAGLMAPSAENFQPWYFVVIRSSEQMSRLIEVMGRVSSEMEPHLRERFASHPEVAADTARFVRSLGGAPVCVLAFALKDNYAYPDTVLESISAALENMLIAAASKGIGSCWLTTPRVAAAGAELRNVFAPGKGELAAIATFGYAAKVPNAPKRKEGRIVII